MKKKKVLLLASRPLANDGITKIAMDVITFNKEIIDFEVACGFGFDNVYGEKLTNEGVTCHLLPAKKRVVSYMRAIQKLIKEHNYDIAYIHGNSALMFLEAIPAKLGGTHVITHCHNTKSNFPIVHYIMKPIFNLNVDKKIGCSSLASRWAYCGNNIITIPNGVETDRFIFDERVRKQIRSQLKWETCKIVGHIGRFNKQKNHIKLIRIFDEMNKMDNTTRLILIGDGELRESIISEIDRRELSQYVQILPFTDRPQDYMQAMDIMIMPSLFEGLCLVAVESQANGLPVLIDNFFSPETSVTNLAISIDLSLSDKEWANTGLDLIKKGRQNVIQQIKDKKMDQLNMMEEIQNLLVNC